MQKLLTFRLRGKGESMKDAERRKKKIERLAKRDDVSEADIIRKAIDELPEKE